MAHPRLQDLHPEALATQVVQLACDANPAIPQKLRRQLEDTAASLVRYAQTGALGEWEKDEDAVDAVQAVCLAIYSRAGESNVPALDGMLEALDEVVEDGAADAFEELEMLDLKARRNSPRALLQLVITAAMARELLSQPGEAVTERHLWALAGLLPSELRRAAKARELHVAHGHVTGPEARRWLGVRGVPGFPARSSTGKKKRN